MSDDDDKTVFGRPVFDPIKGPPKAQPPAPPPQGDFDDEKTAIGQPMPAPAPPAGARNAPVHPSPPPQASPQPWNNPAPDDTWLGGALRAQPAHPARPQNPAPRESAPSAQYGQPLYQPGTGQQPAGGEIFPDIPQDAPQQSRPAQPRITLDMALKGLWGGSGGSSNPLMHAATNLLILLGRLRTGLVDMQPDPLIAHVTRAIDDFERQALAANVPQQDVIDSKYALCATADDIVQNLPGADRSMWQEYSMVARFFGERASGVGFFQKMDEVMRAPGQRFYVLELTLICLSLGFEGQYRALPNGAVELSRIRGAIYETLRRVQPRPDDDLSIKWMPVILGGKRRRRLVPLWVMGATAAVLLVAVFATLSTLLIWKTTDVRTSILALHQGQPAIAIERSQPIIAAYTAQESTQLERIRAGLAEEIDAGQVEVDRNNEWVFVRLGDALQFGSGSSDLTGEFDELAAAIGGTLDDEPGPVRVVGHTDSIPPSGRGRYKTNEQLSVARAQTVATILSDILSQPDRIMSEGKGSVDPIADNGTREGRARNRRVEIMIPRED